MKMKDLLLLLLTIIFVILSIFYIISVCNYDMKELFIDKYSAIGSKCDLDSIFGQNSVLDKDAKYTSEILRRGEAIDDYHTNYNCNSDNYDNIYLREYIDIKNRDLLLAYSCIKMSPTDLVNKMSGELNKNSYKTMLKEDNKNYVEYTNITELTNKIDAKIKSVIRTTSLNDTNINYLYFPVYVFISQAPYLKNANENLKITDSNRGPDGSNYDSCSTNYTVKSNDVCPSTFKMKAEVAIVFLGLKSTGAFITDYNVVKNSITTFKTILSNNISTSKQCFLKCGTNNHTHACGCLNMKGSYTENNKPYNSVCLTNNIETNMTMVYFVNPYADTYSDSKYADKPPVLSEFRWYASR